MPRDRADVTGAGDDGPERGRLAALPEGARMRLSIAQLGAERLSDRELALAVVISMSPATAEWEPDAVKLTNAAERIAEWIAGAGEDAERHRRRVAAVLAGQSTKEIRDVVRVARQLERWTSGK